MTALYLLNVHTIGRAQGGRITRSAAYRAGECIRDERTREVHNFSSRDDVVAKEIVLPSRFSGDASVDWARDRAILWNTAENTDRRDARLAREVAVGIPPILTPACREALVRRFAHDLAERFQSAVDLAIHLPRPYNDERHHHAHLLLTTREITPAGLGQRTIWELTGTERHARGLGPSKGELLWVREHWARVTNETLRAAGFSERVDHRRLEERGIDREAVPHIPQKIRYMELRNGPSEAGNDIRRRHWERVAARMKGPDELARVAQRHKQEMRQWSLERARHKATEPKKLAWSALTKEEVRQRRLERYPFIKDARNKRRRAYYRANRDEIRHKYRELRQRKATLVLEQKEAQHWQQWRERQLTAAQDNHVTHQHRHRKVRRIHHGL